MWNVLLELFSFEGIGFIMSAVGKPLYLDKAIEEKRMVFLQDGVLKPIVKATSRSSLRWILRGWGSLC